MVKWLQVLLVANVRRMLFMQAAAKVLLHLARMQS
jgi:hypothetical protein